MSTEPQTERSIFRSKLHEKLAARGFKGEELERMVEEVMNAQEDFRHTEPLRLTEGSPCTNCGKCCTNESYMGTLKATGEDVKRWRRERRADILRFAFVIGSDNDPWADLWIDKQTGNERYRCPFVRKVPNQNRYLCRIYETRPQVCRDFVPWERDICEV